MAKSKRKPSAAQRDKSNIDLAKKLKASGIISKQAKLHSGSYISKEVLRKVRQFENIARLNYGAVKVKKEVAERAKLSGYVVIGGNKIVGPKTQEFKKRIKDNVETGIKPIKGGYMEEIKLPHSIYDLQTLIQNLGEGGLDSLKLKNEQFAFKYKGNESWRGFPNSKALLEYLLHYKNIDLALSSKPEDMQEEFDSLSIFRLHPNDTDRVIPGVKEREIRSRANRKKRNRPSRRDRLSDLQLHRVREADRLKKEKARERIANDPARYEKYLEAGRKRARDSYNKRKGK